MSLPFFVSCSFVHIFSAIKWFAFTPKQTNKEIICAYEGHQNMHKHPARTFMIFNEWLVAVWPKNSTKHNVTVYQFKSRFVLFCSSSSSFFCVEPRIHPSDFGDFATFTRAHTQFQFKYISKLDVTPNFNHLNQKKTNNQ